MASICIENIAWVTLQEVRENYGILLQGETIESVFPMEQKPKLQGATTLDGKGALAVPGLIDVHIHGMGGYGPEQGTPEALDKMSLAVARQGVTAFCPTLYCAHPDEMERLLTRLSPFIGQEKGARILGFHLEGPFISPHKAGVMKPQDIIPPDVTVLKRLYEAAQGHIAIMTLAPELENIAAVVEFCLQHDILPQAGHTNATYDEFMAGVHMGVSHATHAFNAMRAFNHREPGAAGALLMQPEVSCEMIADGVHVHPRVLAFLRQVKSPDKLVLVTDSLMPTAQPQGPFFANGDEVIFEGGVWRRMTDHVIAGSALTLCRGIKNLIDYGYPLPQAVRCASYNPACLLKLPRVGQVLPGFLADITLLRRDDFFPWVTFIRGKRVGA